jgi:hypothetical protein
MTYQITIIDIVLEGQMLLVNTPHLKTCQPTACPGILIK